MPSKAFVLSLCKHLKVSPLHHSELLELSAVAKVGENVYSGRQVIKKMIERMAAFHAESDTIQFSHRTISVNYDITNGIKTITGQYQVQNLLRDVLEAEALNEDCPRICLTVPFINTFLFDLLHQLFFNSSYSNCAHYNSRKINVKHIFQLSKNPSILADPNYNLKVLSHMLPLAFCEIEAYESFYFYDDVEASNISGTALPYYVLTSRFLLQLSADNGNAVLYDHPEILHLYQEDFEQYLLRSSPLLKQLGLCESMLDTYIATIESAGQVTHLIEPQPCLAKYYTDELIEEKLRSNLPNRAALKARVSRLYEKYRHFEKPHISFFSAEGIKYLAETGIMANLPPKFATLFTIGERILLLEQLRKDISNDSYYARAANAACLTVSPLATIQLHGKNKLMIVAINSQGVMCASFIEEKSICDAFYDFLDSLIDSHSLYDKKQTIEIIDEALLSLKTAADEASSA